MANIKSAKKRILVTARQTEVNKARRSRIRTFIKRVVTAIESGDVNAAEEAFKQAQPEIDRGVVKGILKKGTAARRKSRLSSQIKALKSK